jgi:hypothetical protein
LPPALGRHASSARRSCTVDFGALRASRLRPPLAVCKVRALLADVHDGLIDLPETTARRDSLMHEVQNVYEHALPADREAYQIAREALGAGTGTPSDPDIDRLLPASLRQTAGATPT